MTRGLEGRRSVQLSYGRRTRSRAPAEPSPTRSGPGHREAARGGRSDRSATVQNLAIRAGIVNLPEPCNIGSMGRSRNPSREASTTPAGPYMARPFRTAGDAGGYGWLTGEGQTRTGRSGLRVMPQRTAASRDGQIRTGDPLVPNQVRYRTAPRPVVLQHEILQSAAVPSTEDGGIARFVTGRVQL
jgi:hypothetical protein